MRVLLLSFCSIFITATVHSQTKLNKENTLALTTGIGLRVTPVHLGDLPPGYPNYSFLVQTDENVNGPAFYIGLLHYWSKPRISFEYENSFRYKYIYIIDGQHILHDGYRLSLDFHFTLSKFFPIKKNTLKTGIGYSLLNHGTDFFDTASYWAYNLNFATINANISYQVRQLNFELINRFTTSYFLNEGPMYIPELRVTYAINLKNKKIF